MSKWIKIKAEYNPDKEFSDYISGFKNAKTQHEKVMFFYNLIEDKLNPGVFTRVDDLAVDLYVPQNDAPGRKKYFDRAIQELIMNGRVERNGNAIRLNQ